MKDVLLLLGKPLCPVCALANTILSHLEDKYPILRVNILSLFTKKNVVDVLGMRTYELVSALMEFFGGEYVMVLKMQPDTGEVAFVPFKEYLVVGQISMDALDYDQLERSVEDAPYGVWPPRKKSVV
ncbi:MC059L [Molluscum contagiosum virus subtype 1]|uniref:Glutaredoxin-2 n=3 Tax=Molluscum contagiosum virus TaxID=10279 RepID=Q98227_MCV1|nr:MC059L [Molluscum contagiosum virus subtype 1]AZT86321.1 MC059L [Molluscum contagiosum virus]AAC55187.1 MC059L [Molluscum contagiosum virus subtype 1]AQY16808.1 MC059 [Molluscum contagiosum virus subtype 1]AQY16987.1 MC059 [Molluscum contagiosum virus subtype 1]AQY17166.1 MC059 [Molluscum contagiosum virus subtype 1]